MCLLGLFDVLGGLCLLINIDVNFYAVCLLCLFDALVGLCLLINIDVNFTLCACCVFSMFWLGCVS